MLTFGPLRMVFLNNVLSYHYGDVLCRKFWETLSFTFFLSRGIHPPNVNVNLLLSLMTSFYVSTTDGPALAETWFDFS